MILSFPSLHLFHSEFCVFFIYFKVLLGGGGKVKHEQSLHYLSFCSHPVGLFIPATSAVFPLCSISISVDFMASFPFLKTDPALEPTAKEAEIPRRFSLTSSLASSSSAMRRTKGIHPAHLPSGFACTLALQHFATEILTLQFFYILKK